VGQDWKEEHSSCSAAPELRSWPGAGAADEGEARFEQGCGIWCGHRCCTLLLYPPLCPGLTISNYASGLVELGGLERPAPCLQTGGSTSTGVHPRSSQSWGVRPGPFGSGPVAVLSCCTHWQVPQQCRNVAAPLAASPGFLPPLRVMTGGPEVACRGVDLTLLCRRQCASSRRLADAYGDGRIMTSRARPVARARQRALLVRQQNRWPVNGHEEIRVGGSGDLLAGSHRKSWWVAS
jgi:hypothetical protein